MSDIPGLVVQKTLPNLDGPISQNNNLHGKKKIKEDTLYFRFAETVDGGTFDAGSITVEKQKLKVRNDS